MSNSGSSTSRCHPIIIEHPPSNRLRLLSTNVLMMLTALTLTPTKCILRRPILVSAFTPSIARSARMKARQFSAPSASSSSSMEGQSDDNIDTVNSVERAVKRIAIVGSGAVGSYYGARLWEAHKDSGTQVMFHLRNEHYDHCIQHGIDVTSYDGDLSIPANELLAFPTTEDMAKNAKGEDGEFDWVVCALKSTSLDAVPELIEPLISSNTRLLMIMNGLIEDDLIEMMQKQQQSKGLDGIGCKTIYGGMALICSNRLAPGKIDHSYGGKLAVGVAYSSDASSGDKWVEDDKKAIVDLFEPVTPKVPFVYEPNLRRGRWWKNVWNLPFSGISVAMGGITVDRIVNDPSLRGLAYKVIDETLKVANADLLNRGSSTEELLGEETANEMMTLSDGMGPYKTSTMLDLHARKPMEVKYLFRKAVDQADALGVEVPHLETLVCQIEAYQRHYGLF